MARKKRFSEREGIKGARATLQVGNMDAALRNRLWNVVARIGPVLGEQFIFEVWNEILEARLDSIGANQNAYDEFPAWTAFSNLFAKAPWNIVYDILEVVVDCYGMQDELDEQLEAGGSGYRFVDDVIVPITSEIEIAEIEKAQEATGTPTLKSVREHLDKAVELFALRPEPDYANSIKEAVSALEGMGQLITGAPGATLGVSVKNLEKAGIKIPPALVKALDAYYGWACGSGGIRHFKKENIKDTDPEIAEARFFLVTASAYMNFLIALAADAGMKL